VNTTVPVGGDAGEVAPVTVAVSEMLPPSTAVGVAEVAMVGVALPTTDASLTALQAPATDG
jgi:hypothetical protein